MKGHRNGGLTVAVAALLLTGGLLVPIFAQDVQAVRNNNLNTNGIANLAPAFVAPGMVNVTILTFALRDSANGEVFTRAAVNFTGSNISDIKAVKLFYESPFIGGLGGSGGTFNNTTDTHLATNASFGSNPVILNLSYTLPRNIRVQFYVLFDISSNATDNHTVDARIDMDALLINGMTWPDVAYDPAGASKVDAAPPSNWSGFRPAGWQASRTPDCIISVRDNVSGLAVKTAQYSFSINGGGNWSGWTNATCTGVNGTNATQNITASKVLFGNDTAADNLITFRIWDMVGNMGISPDFTVKADSTGPEGWAFISPSGWYTRDMRPDVNVSVQDVLSGLDNLTATAAFSHDGGATWTNVSAVDITGPSGSVRANITAWAVPFDEDSGLDNYIRFNLSDMAGNHNASPPYRIRIDTTPPDAPFFEPEPEYTGGTCNTLNFSAAADPVSGQSKYRVWCDDEPSFPDPAMQEMANATSCIFSDLTDGIRYYYMVIQLNNAGLESNRSLVVNSTQDASPPFTKATTFPATPDGDNGWFINETKVIFNASDNSSGVALTKYQVNAGEAVNGTQLVLSAEGEFAIHYWSEDNVGNSEPPRTINVKIDLTPPVAVIGPVGTAYQNEAVQFDGSASTGALMYTWDFGDGLAPMVGAKVNHAYSQTGAFTVTLTVKDRAGLTCTTHAEVKVLEKGVNYPPVADVGTIPPVYAGKAATFDGSKSTDEDKPTLRYDWDFGDGSSGTGAVVTHSYPQAGTFNLKLKVTDSAGLYDTKTREVRVYTEGENHPPLAHISQANVAYVGEPVLLDASNSSDEDIATVVFSWDFGDGTTGKGMIVSHAYGNESIYLVRLNLTDRQGLPGGTELAIRVFVRGSNLPPIAQFTFFPNAPRAGQTVEFDGSLSTDEDPFTLNFTWDFGDGTGSQGKLAGHAFPKKGEYEVKLRVRDRGGLTDTYTYRVAVAKGNTTVPVTANEWWPWAAAAVVAVGVVMPVAYLATRGRKKRDEPWTGEPATGEQPSHAVEGPVSLITPIPAEKAQPPIVVETGLNYLMDADHPTVSYNALANLTSDGAVGLMVTPVHPKKVQKATQLQNTQLIWLSDIIGDEPSMDPSKMDYEIAEKIITFIKENRDKGVVLVDGLELLIQCHGFDKVLQFVHGIVEVASVNEATVLVNVHSKAMKEVEFNQLKRKFDRW
jgi:PKD repeat protein